MLIFGALHELANHRGGEALLDSISRRVILEGGHGDGGPFRRQISGASGDMIAAAGEARGE